MNVLRDAFENIRYGLLNAWDRLSDEARSLLVGLFGGFVLGAMTVGLWLS